MKIAQLKKIINDLPDETDVLLHWWGDHRSLFFHVDQACNYEYQLENKELIFTAQHIKY